MRGRRSVGAWVTAGALAAGLAACGGSGSASGTGSTGAAGTTRTTATSGINISLDPCTLVTQQQVAQALGQPVDAGKGGGAAPGSRGCTWTTSSGDVGADPTTHVASVTLEVVGPNPALKSRYPTARSYYTFTKQIYTDTTDVPGIGDAAFSTHSNHWIYAIHGNTMLRVFVTGGASDAVGPQVQALMKDAIANT